MKKISDIVAFILVYPVVIIPFEICATIYYKIKGDFLKYMNICEDLRDEKEK